MEGNNFTKIEDMKRKLYDPKGLSSKPRPESTFHSQDFKVPNEWKKAPITDNDMRKPKTSFFKKFFIGAVIFFVGAIGFAYYMYSKGGVTVSSENIDMKVIGNAFTKGGEDLPLQIEISNRNNANLDSANLLVEYPRGARDALNDIVRLPRQSLGTILKGQVITKPVLIKLYGEEKLIRTVKITLEYHPQGSNAVFTKELQYPITISLAPLSVRIDAPDTVTSDQPLSFVATTTLNTSLPAENTTLQLTYPTNFVFESARPSPSIGKNMWSLSSLTQANPIAITVKGRIIGQDGDQPVFHAYIGTPDPSNSSEISVVYASLLKTMTIAKPFIDARILVSNQDLPVYTAAGGENVSVQISWANNLPNRISNAQIILNMSGNAFDKNGVNPLEGYYDSLNSRIVWDKNSIPELASVEPGASGTISFNIKPLSFVGSRTIVRDGPQIALDVSIKGSQPASGSSISDINNYSKKIIKIVSDLQITSSATSMSGPMPPKAESETRYKVLWTLSNSVNSINQAQARSVLPIYVTWVGTQGGEKEKITYNSTTREVIWDIGTIKARTGIDTTRQASFIVALKPSLSQVGSVPQLMKDVFLTGIDSFTSTSLKNSTGPINTFLSNDPTFKSGNERVVN